MTSIFDTFDETRERQMLKFLTPNFSNRLDSRLNEKLRSKSDSCSPFAKYHLSEGKSRSLINEGCFPSVKMISKSPITTPRTPFQTLQLNSQQCTRNTPNEELKKSRVSIKPFEIFDDEPGSFLHDENGERARTHSNEGCLFSGKKILKSPLATPRISFQRLKSNSQQRSGRTPKESKSPHQMTKPFKIFEDPKSESIFQDNVNGGPPSKLDPKINWELLPDNLNKEKYVNDIRRRKYITLDKKSKALNFQQHGQRVPKNKLKRNCKLMKPFEIFEDPESQPFSYDNVNENTVDRATTNDLLHTETIGESFWSEENYTPLWDNMLTAEEINTVNTTLDICSNLDGISDLCVSPEIPCMLIDEAGLELVPITPAFILIVDSPKDIPVPWKS